MPMWREVPGFPGYRVSDDGQVSGPRGPLKVRVEQGYCRVWMYRDGKRVPRQVHHLVLEAFVGPRPDGLEARHMNGNGTDNRVSNLSWGTRSENQLDRVRHGTHNHARKTHCVNEHEFTPENTYVYPGTTWRRCRKCYREQNRKARAK